MTSKKDLIQRSFLFRENKRIKLNTSNMKNIKKFLKLTTKKAEKGYEAIYKGVTYINKDEDALIADVCTVNNYVQ